MKIYLARHGRTNYNDRNICNADPSIDVHLTPIGVEQAKALAEKLKNIPLDHIFISELRRTKQTAEPVNAFHNLTLNVDQHLNDIYSNFEGKTFEEYSAALAAAPNKWTASFDGGESIEDLKERVARFIDELRATSYKAVLIVTSEWVIRVAIAHIKNISNKEAWDLPIEQGDFLTFDL